jgi:hypothetical protein
MHAMYSAMLILIIPSFLLCTGIAVLAYRRRNKDSTE